MALNATSALRGSPDCVIPYEQQTCSKFVIVVNGERTTSIIIITLELFALQRKFIVWDESKKMFLLSS